MPPLAPDGEGGLTMKHRISVTGEHHILRPRSKRFRSATLDVALYLGMRAAAMGRLDGSGLGVDIGQEDRAVLRLGSNEDLGHKPARHNGNSEDGGRGRGRHEKTQVVISCTAGDRRKCTSKPSARRFRNSRCFSHLFHDCHHGALLLLLKCSAHFASSALLLSSSCAFFRRARSPASRRSQTNRPRTPHAATPPRLSPPCPPLLSPPRASSSLLSPSPPPSRASPPRRAPPISTTRP